MAHWCENRGASKLFYVLVIWLDMLYVLVIWTDMHLVDMSFLIALPCMQLVFEGGDEELHPHALLVEVECAT
jgi:hypothetical protein